MQTDVGRTITDLAKSSLPKGKSLGFAEVFKIEFNSN